MKTCIGCKHLTARGLACKANDKFVQDSINDLTGTITRIDPRHPENGGWRPTPRQMRSSAYECGPNAVLYEEKFSLINWIFLKIETAFAKHGAKE